MTYLLSAFSTGDWIKTVQLVLYSGTAYLALRSAPFRRRTVRLLLTTALIGSVIMIAVTAIKAGNDERGAAALWVALVLLITAALIVWRVVSYPLITVQSIFGALSAYLLIGLMFASFYSAMYYLDHQIFFTQAGQPPAAPTFQYFSFTTLTTLGYGDYTAATNGGRAVAVMEAVTGQIFLATLVARLVAAYRPDAARSADPSPDREPPD